MTTIDWMPSRPPRRGGVVALIAVVVVLLLGGGTALSYYIDQLWFESLGFGRVFWDTVRFQGLVFAASTIGTFALLYPAFLLLKPSRLELTSGPLVINGQPLRLPVEPVLRLIGFVGALVVSITTGLSMVAQWEVFAVWWHQPTLAGALDPVFGRSDTFYLCTLPVWQLLTDWATTMAVLIGIVALFFGLIVGGSRALGRHALVSSSAIRGLCASTGLVLATLALNTYVGRFGRLLDDHTIFSGVTYTDAHIVLPGLLWVSLALGLGALGATAAAVVAPRLRFAAGAAAPALLLYLGVSLTAWYVNGFIVKPNELVRERPFIAQNITATQRAFALDRITEQPFPAEPGLAAIRADANAETIRNLRLWDWRALQDTLRQIQEIRTYYDFPDIDIDRYRIDGTVRQMMLAVRELNVERLPESSRNWINERLVYTHGYGVTMNPVNGFAGEGLPELVLGNMPMQSTTPSLRVTRPQVYFGELTNTDVYVRTGQKEFDYPQGETNTFATYEGTGGIRMGSLGRRILIALERGDIGKVPFSDDITADSRLLMRRNIRERLATIAPFLRFDTDPYIVVTADGRLVWMVDAFTTAATYPSARHYRFLPGVEPVNYVRNSVKATVDAYDGTVTLYQFEETDPVIAAWARMFPTLFRPASSMPDDLRAHVRYPELLLDTQAAVYGLYHMTTPDVFYNREDLWTVAAEARGTDAGESTAQAMEPNFVLMTLPGQSRQEFVEMLPFTPANRNNLIGWIAGRSDGEHYGTALVYDFPKTKLVDGPLQIEARIDQNAELSGQLSLWNQQGSHVRRGTLLVMPLGSGVLYAEPIYLQAERSPMPELRIVVLALQDRLAYGPTFEAALAALYGTAPSTLGRDAASATTADRGASTVAHATAATPHGPTDQASLIREAARALEDYQRLTAEGKLGEAGARLDALKLTLDHLSR